MRGLTVVVAGVGVLAAGCSDGTALPVVASSESTSSVGAPTTPVRTSNMPSDYRFILRSSCGERGLLGRYTVVVRDGRVSSVTNLNRDYPYQPDLAEVPTLQGLLDKAHSAGAEAVVDLDLDEAGLPKYLMIDHVPNGVDDEECYAVSVLSDSI